MTTDPSTPYEQAQRALTAWHTTHPRATLAEIEVAVEQQIEQLRRHLLTDEATAEWQETHPQCSHCGETMRPKAWRTRRLVLQGEQSLDLDRCYVECPQCETGLFPPG